MATPPGKVPIAESAAEGLKFLTDHWLKLLPSAVLFGLGYALYFYASSLSHAAKTDSPLRLLGMIAILALTITVGASYYRLALKGEFNGPLGLKVGGDEGRYLSVTVWNALPFIGIALAAIALITPMLMAAAKTSGHSLERAAEDPKIMSEILGIAGAPAVLVLLAAMIAVIWLAVRLGLGAPATIAENRVRLWSTAAWTKGNFWRIIASMFLLLGPLFILAAVAQSLTSLALGVNPDEVQAGIAPPSPAVAIYGLVYGVTSAMFSLVPSVGLFAHLYKGLRPSTE